MPEISDANHKTKVPDPKKQKQNRPPEKLEAKPHVLSLLSVATGDGYRVYAAYSYYTT
jgi:hypothetical protein